MNDLNQSLPVSLPAINGIPFIRSIAPYPIARELARLEKACRLKGWNFRLDLAVMAQPPKTGFRSKQCQPLGHLLDRVRRGELNPSGSVLLIEKVDRISRSGSADAEFQIFEIVKMGISILFVSNGLQLVKGDENNCIKRLLLSFELQRSAHESAYRSSLIREGVRQKMNRQGP